MKKVMTPRMMVCRKEKEKINLNFESIGLGTLRTSESYIYALLLLEDQGMRERIIADVCKKFRITGKRIQDVQQDKGCPKCGISLLSHKDNGGRCF